MKITLQDIQNGIKKLASNEHEENKHINQLIVDTIYKLEDHVSIGRLRVIIEEIKLAFAAGQNAYKKDVKK